MEQRYTLPEMGKEIAVLKNVFDIVRLVDPIRCLEYSIPDRSFERVFHNIPCYRALEKDRRCKNCISIRALQEEKPHTKFEFADKAIYYMMAKSIQVDGKSFIVEMISNVTDHTGLDGKECSDFIDKIIQFNTLIVTDELTGSYNRRFFNEVLPGLINNSVEKDESLAVIVIDIDDFKGINDTYGHLVGDQALCAVARFLENNIRENHGDFVARMGGDEFLVVLNHIKRDVAIRRVKDISKKAQNILIEGAGQKTAVSLSFGMAFAGDFQEPSLASLMECADKRLYQSKKKGKNRVTYHDLLYL